MACSRFMCGRHFFPIDAYYRDVMLQLSMRGLLDDEATYDRLRRDDHLYVGEETHADRYRRIEIARRAYAVWLDAVPTSRPLCNDCIADLASKLPGILDDVAATYDAEVREKAAEVTDALERLQADIKRFLAWEQALDHLQPAGLFRTGWLVRKGWESSSTDMSGRAYSSTYPDIWLGKDGLVHLHGPRRRPGRLPHADELTQFRKFFERVGFRSA